MFRSDICIAGAGIIGLSLALELRARGLSVVVLDAGAPMREASIAAAGMLATDDPHNPLELSALSHLSLSLYPEFLERIAKSSGMTVPYQTSHTLQLLPSHTPAQAPLSGTALTRLLKDEQSIPPGFTLLREHSIDPHQLAPSLLAAVTASSVTLLPGQPVLAAHSVGDHLAISTPAHKIEAAHFVDCTGAWAGDPAYTVVPVKGQMLSVTIPRDLSLAVTVRTRDIYIVPRTTGPNAGLAIIGATVEDIGFDKTIHAGQIAELHRTAVTLLPQLSNATIVDSWSGLRPATPDRLPLLGAHPSKPRQWVATGHFRNGILLAPATARVMAQLLLGNNPPVSLESFSPSRNLLPRMPSQGSHSYTDIRPAAHQL